MSDTHVRNKKQHDQAIRKHNLMSSYFRENSLAKVGIDYIKSFG